jgi:hypothetical protein
VQAIAHHALEAEINALLYLARQGIAIRGKTDNTANYNNLLKLLSLYCSDLNTFLQRKRSYTSHDVQNELLELCANDILGKIQSEIATAGPFGIIVDGCQDNNYEQLSVCIRYCDKDVHVQEEPVGFYATSKSDAESISNCIKDVLCRLNLQLLHIIGQSYDGASTMSGCVSGVQKRIKEVAPSAEYVHCHAHCLDLALQEAGKKIPMVRDAVSLVHDMGVFLNASALRRTTFKDLQHNAINENADMAEEFIDLEDGIAVVEEDITNEVSEAEVVRMSTKKSLSMRKLCTTRWLARTPALQDAIRGYVALQIAFAHFSKNAEPSAAYTAGGIETSMNQGKTYFTILVCLKVFHQAELCSRYLQRTGITVAEAVHHVSNLKTYYKGLRNEKAWQQIWNEAMLEIRKLDLEEPSVPRQRRVPRRLEQTSNPAEPHQFVDPHSLYRMQFFELLDLLINELDERFQQIGVEKLMQLERILLGTNTEEDIDSVMQSYSIFLPSRAGLARQLDSLKDIYNTPRNIGDTVLKLQEMINKGVPELFCHVIVLCQIYLAAPVTSVECERSFSTMRRLKTWLRGTTGQPRLNHEFILTTHSERSVDVGKVIRDFVRLNSQRRDDFGL